MMENWVISPTFGLRHDGMTGMTAFSIKSLIRRC